MGDDAGDMGVVAEMDGAEAAVCGGEGVTGTRIGMLRNQCF